jgi:carbon-monoxide dehydrogenase medium subunit
MIPQEFGYASPASLPEALALIASGNAKILAGGMSLIPLMKLRLAAPESVVDLGRIPDLNTIREEGGAIRIGAMTTHYAVESSALIRAKCPLLAEAAASIGDVQVRNMGTIGGSIAHADPAADYPASLMALEAQVRVVSANGERTIAIADFLVDALATALEPGEIVREVIVRVEAAGTGVSYKKMVQPASGFAVVGVAVRVRKASGKITMARVGITGLAGKAFRATNAEKLLEGTEGNAADIRKASAVAGAGVDANSDLFASANYRLQMAKVYASRAINEALLRTS